MNRPFARSGVWRSVWAVGLCLGGWSAVVSAGGPAPRVVYVPARDYFAVVQREIQGARSSIVVGLYLFSFRANEPQSPVFQLAQCLVRAHRAGVRVDVLLDQNFNFLEGESFPLAEGKNRTAYEFLRDAGVPVFFDTASSYTHSKIIVIDGETVILGSSNWSYSAFEQNEEANLLVRSKEVAREALDSLAAVPRAPPVGGEEGPLVNVPGEFLENPALLGRMISTPDERAFDAYLYLVARSSSSIVVDDADMARALGLGNLDRLAYRRQLVRTLRKLQNTYGLVRFSADYGQNPLVELRPLHQSPRVCRVPVRYGALGWDRRLSFAGKCFYLVSRYESEVSLLRPRWSVARSTLARRYGGAPPFWGTGVIDLRRHNLLEVEYSTLSTDSDAPRQPSVYTPNPLYDTAELELKFASLSARFGVEAVERVRRVAGVVYEDNDIEAITRLCELDREYGAQRIEEAARIVAQKRPDNPLRSMAYLIGIVRNGYGRK